jgi:predicted SAM-dependent methyltransferase
MALSGYLYRTFKAPRAGTAFAHLGPGRDKYAEGWINVDANLITAKLDVWADLRNPLPFHDNSLAAIYSHHVIEHLPNAPKHLREVWRCLRPGGVFRVGVPNIDCAIAKFSEQDFDWFGDWPERRRSIGGQFEKFVFCSGEHRTAFTSCYLTELLEDAGFEEITKRAPITDSGYPQIFETVMAKEWESDFDYPHTLLLECRKPLK